MTTIAYRNRIIASDSGASCGGVRMGGARKITRNAVGDLAGAAGSAPFVEAFLRWFEAGERTPQPEAGEGEDYIDRAIIIRNEPVPVVEVHEPGGMFVVIDIDYYAIGSGKESALGAMHRKGTAVQAIEAAKAHDEHTFGRVVSLGMPMRGRHNGRKR